MQSEQSWIASNWLKLMIGLILAALAAVFLLRQRQPQPVPVGDLPPYPSANVVWIYDDADHTLMSEQGEKLYRLTEDGTNWQPVVSSGLLGLLPANVQVTQNAAGEWVIRNADGNVYQVWDALSLQWKPAMALTLTYEAGALAAAKSATALAPTEPEASATPPAPEATPTVPADTPAPTVTPAENCRAAAVSRLTAGGSARVLLNLNLRSAPEIADNNIVRAYEAGQTVKLLTGPNCLPYQESAYLWWQVSGEGGVTGWVVEATVSGSAYFLEPIP